MQRQVSGEAGQKLCLQQIELSKKLKDGGKNAQMSLSAMGTSHERCSQRQMLISERMMLPNETI